MEDLDLDESQLRKEWGLKSKSTRAKWVDALFRGYPGLLLPKGVLKAFNLEKKRRLKRIKGG